MKMKIVIVDDFKHQTKNEHDKNISRKKQKIKIIMEQKIILHSDS